MNTFIKEILVLGDGDFSYSNSLISSSLECSLTSTVFLSRQEIVSTYGSGNIKYDCRFGLHEQLLILKD